LIEHGHAATTVAFHLEKPIRNERRNCMSAQLPAPSGQEFEMPIETIIFDPSSGTTHALGYSAEAAGPSG